MAEQRGLVAGRLRRGRERSEEGAARYIRGIRVETVFMCIQPRFIQSLNW